MASFDAVNYALRPSKSIQRQLIFEGIRRIKTMLGTAGIYVGLGSIWFTDFIAAHKILGIHEMHSIEADPIGYARAVYNAPYASVVMHQGLSSDVLPELLADPALRAQSWTIWLDYDGQFSEEIREDLRILAERLPTNSIILISFNAHEMSYGRVPERRERLKGLYGDVLPDDITSNDCKGDRLAQTLASVSTDLLKSFVLNSGRADEFVPAFSVAYRDGSPMITVGGIIASGAAAGQLSAAISAPDWCGSPGKMIVAPHLTLREAAAMQALLPSAAALTRADIQRIGFDLDDDQVEAFAAYYRQYPSYVQIVT